MYNEVELRLFPDTDISELRAVPGPRAPGLGEFECTLYVGLARAVSPTNTNFRLTFLLTRLQEALYEDLAV